VPVTFIVMRTTLSANKLIRFDNNGGSARSCDMHVTSFAVESALLIQFPLFVAVTEHTK
jgi:hypothetical protein